MRTGDRKKKSPPPLSQNLIAKHPSLPEHPDSTYHVSCDDLLTIYLSLRPNERSCRFWTITEAALKIGKAQRTIREWFYRGLIEGVYIHKTIYLDRQSVEAFLIREDKKRRGI